MTKITSAETGLEIAVIGMSGKFPGASHLDLFWENLKNGVETISRFTADELRQCGVMDEELNNPNYVRAYGILENKGDFDSSFFGYSPKEAEILDPMARLFHECAWEALEDAGYDPFEYNGAIGLYAGASTGFDWHVLKAISRMSQPGGDSTMHMTENSLLLSSRIAYKLNLMGPSITLFTACSTSLVAIHTACRSLLTGECQIALAGAGSVAAGIKLGYMYQEGMILSPDGHCRPFDAHAGGTLYGDGVGVVVLKRLKQAVAEADNILGIIKASAVNNDGSVKASYTAPGKKRIADVVRTALKLSRLNPEALHFIEAHGTATAMGDTIEIEALNAAFATEKKGFCALGSIKSNFGHLDVAAGMAGFIKVLLALKHRLIPPSLHFESPNPAIHFIDSPFYVNTTLSKLEGEEPFRAGVCSFGIGGTNAFIIVEAITPHGVTPRSEGAQLACPQLLLLSARTDSALQQMTANLAGFLQENPHLDLADIAYTLQVGRRGFSRRRMLVCTTTAEAAQLLSTGDATSVHSAMVTGKERTVEPENPLDNLSFPATATELTAIGFSWLSGTPVPWQDYYNRYATPASGPRRLSLPFYPFERHYYWIETPPQGILPMGAPTQLESRGELQDWVYIPSWERTPLLPQPQPLGDSAQREVFSWLLFIDESPFAQHLLHYLVHRHHDVIIVRAREHVAFTRVQPHEFIIDPAQDQHYDALFDALQETHKIPHRLIHLWNVPTATAGESIPCSDFQVKQALDLGFYSLLNITRAMGTHRFAEAQQILVVTGHMEDVSGDEPFLSPQKAPLWGVLDVLPLEYPDITCCGVDILPPLPGSPREALYIAYLLAEMESHLPHRRVAYRGDYRWTPVYKPFPLQPAVWPGLVHRGVYLITGGLGGIGLALAQYLTQHCSARLILVGRTAANHPQPHHDILQHMEQQGAQMLIFSADVTDEARMRELILQAEHRFGPINGVFHAAGVADFAGVMEKRSRTQNQEVLSAKILGTLTLDRIFSSKPQPPSFLLLFSSLGTVLYGDRAGQVAYNAANHFLEMFACARMVNTPGLEPVSSGRMHTMSISWPPWLATGMARNMAVDTEKNRLGITVAEALQVLTSLLGTALPQVVVCPQNLGQHIQQLHSPAPRMVVKPETGGFYPRPPLSTPYVAPTEQIQLDLVQVWQKFFGIRDMGIHDDFFELGGDSLTAITLITDIHRQLCVRVPITQLFNTPTIAGLANSIRAIQLEPVHPAAEANPIYMAIQPVEEREYYPLSSVQKRIYILQQMAPGSIGYNTPLVLELSGTLDKELLSHVFRRLLGRHESLRTSFALLDNQPVQRIHPAPPFQVHYFDLNSPDHAHPVSGQNDRRVAEDGIIAHFIRPFDLSHPTLWRVGLIRLNPEQHVLITDMHHIITDGSSIGILIREFILLYAGQTLPPLRIQYKDYAHWQNSSEQKDLIKKQEVFWLAQFAGEIPVLNLPTDFVRPPVQSFVGQSVTFTIGPEETTALKQIAQQESATLFMILLALYNVLLAKLSNQEDIIVGIPMAGRTHADLQQVIGMLVNTLALRNFPVPTNTFTQFLQNLKATTLAAFENQDYLFEDLVDLVTQKIGRDASRNPIFDTTFNLLNFSTPYPLEVNMEAPGIRLATREFERGVAIFDLTFQGAESAEGLTFTVEYCTHLFKPQTISRFISYFKTLVATVVVHPQEQIALIEIIPSLEKEQILVQFNQTAMDCPKDKTIHQLFQEQAQRTPDGVALIGATVGASPRGCPGLAQSQITYAQLNETCNSLATHLITMGVTPETIVGIMVDRSVETIGGILGILKSGAAYLPIDPDYPPERIDFILHDSQTQWVFTSQKISALIHESPPVHTVKPIPLAHPSHLAYIIYTSGSTGNPKGVIVEHASLVNLISHLTQFFNMGIHDRVLQLATLCFDASIEHIFIALTRGAGLVLIDRETLLDMEQFEKYLTQQSITHLDTVPSLLNQLNPALFPSLKRVISGGDVCPKGLAQEWYKCCRFYNEYGPTEATVVSIEIWIRHIEDSLPVLPIGKPIGNAQVYLLDKGKNMVPMGVTGEIYIGGAGIARGYLNNPQLTADTFFPLSQFPALCTGSTAGTRMYKSGDLGRWLPDGNIEFLGRVDHQVKIRGFRVELGEIESRLSSLTGITQCLVVAGARTSGEKYLCAYFVADRTLRIPDIRDYLTRQLPDYMIPTYFVPLEKMPVTAIGKLDKKHLPVPEAISTHPFVPPSTPLEKTIADIWQETLEIPQVGMDDNFFEMGGHSLKATIMISKIHKVCQVKVPLVEIFKAPRIRELALFIQGKNKELYMSIEPTEEKEYYPLSSAQKRLFFLHQFDPAGLGYNMPMVIPLGEGIDIHPLENTLKKLIARHDNFRTSFIQVHNETFQRVHRQVDFAMPLLDFATPGPEDPRSPAKMATLIQDFVRPFDLSRAPLLRSTLMRTPEKHYFWLVDMHHIISDGTSQTILTQEFFTLFSGLSLPPLALQYKDFSQWQNRLLADGSLKNQEAYWLSQLAGEIPRLDLPVDLKRPPLFSFAGARYSFMLAPEETLKFQALGNTHGVTLYMNILATLNVLFYKYTGQTDILIGSVIAGRHHADLQHIVGMFVNTLVLRNAPDGEKTYQTFLKEVSLSCIHAFENQDVQFEQLVEKLDLERDPSRNPLFDISMVVENDSLEVSPPPYETPLYETPLYENNISKFDITFFIHEAAPNLFINIQYYTGIFKPESIQRLVSHLTHLIKHITQAPATPLKNIQIISEPEKQQILYEFNHPEFPNLIPKTIHALFEEQVWRTPEGIALSRATLGAPPHGCPDLAQCQRTYRELNNQSTRLSHHLISQGLGENQMVGLLVDRSFEMIVAILAIWKAGCSYIPLNPKAPASRSLFMLKDCGAQFLLTTPPLVDVRDTIQNWTGQTLLIEARGEDSGAPIGQLPTQDPSRLAYIIFTSGSTGNPKGVPISHAHLGSLFLWSRTHLPIGPTDRVLQNLSYYFDWSVWEMFYTLTTGASLVLVADDVLLDPARCIPFMKENRISMLHITPTQFQHLIGMDGQLETLKYLILGAERLSYDLLKRCFAVVPEECRVFNGYGPTETTIMSSALAISRGVPDSLEALTSVPIGIPVNNTILLVLDSHFNLCPVHITGQLYIGGDSLAPGYLNNPELTAASFLSLTTLSPSSQTSLSLLSSILSPRCHTLYKTGDLTRWLPNGTLEFLGRIDQQVKIRGFRIELGEIEHQLVTHDHILEAVVLARLDANEEKYLCAYYVSDTPLGQDELREYLFKNVPDYMIPSSFVPLEKIPMTPNGKIDTNALPEPGYEDSPGLVAPQDELETQLLEIWGEVLHLEKDRISTKANFFHLGGHSLKATTLTSTLHKVLNVKVPLAEIFKNPTICQLAEYIRHAGGTPFISIPAVEKKEYYVLSSLQKRLYILQQMNPLSTAYNIPQVIPLGPSVDTHQLTRIFTQLLARHESLRTSFQTVNDIPVQQVHNSDEVSFTLENYQGFSLSEILNRFVRPFDLSRPPLCRAGLVQLDQADSMFFLLLVDIHHSISDGVSQEVLARDFRALFFTPEENQHEVLPPLRIHYKDFAQWLNSPAQIQEIKKQEAYWLREFAGEIPVLHLPLDFPRSAAQHMEGQNLDFTLEKQSVSVLKHLASQQGVTLYMMFLALFNVWLAKLCGQEDIILGTASAGRHHADLENLIGMFVNTLLLRNYPTSEKTFIDFLKEIKQRTLAAFENQDYPFEDLVDKIAPARTINRNPLFDVMFNFMELEGEPPVLPEEDPNHPPSPLDLQANPAKFDIAFTISSYQQETIQFNIQYSTQLFKTKSIQEFIKSFRSVVSRVVENPTQTISQINMVSSVEMEDVWADSSVDLENE